MKMKTQVLTTALTLSLAAGAAWAEVPESVADRLGKDLTPMGAEKAGTKGGVASWSGKAIDGSALLGGYDGGALPNPYAADKPLYTITSSNAGKYDSVLTDGQKALLATYPDTYKMNVYKSRRSCTYPEYVYKAAKRNAVVGKNVDGGSGVSEAIMSSPFPIPSTALEIVWNHTLRYRGNRIARDFNYAAPTANGQYTLTDTRDEIVFDWSNPQFSRAEDLNNISIWFVAYTSAPARRAGNVVLVHETLNMAKEGRKAWTYSPGTRRVRRAPNIAYDNPSRDPSKILDIARAAALDDTVESFPEGLDTILGERGVTLSGGQKQRTALARGLIRESPILILDDCFSAVDTETEERILAGLKRVRNNSTTLLVSHRVSTARHADRILVLDKGEIQEIGTHEELLRQGGFYAELEYSQRNLISESSNKDAI